MQPATRPATRPQPRSKPFGVLSLVSQHRSAQAGERRPRNGRLGSVVATFAVELGAAITGATNAVVVMNERVVCVEVTAAEDRSQHHSIWSLQRTCRMRCSSALRFLCSALAVCSLGDDPSARLRHEGTEIVQVVECVRHDFVVDFRVLVHQDVPKANGLRDTCGYLC